MERAGSGLRFDFNGAGTVAAILRSVIRGQNFELSDGFGVRIDVQRGVAAVIHVVAAVELPVVVLVAPTVHAVGNVSVYADLAVIVASLIDYAGAESDKLREVATV